MLQRHRTRTRSLVYCGFLFSIGTVLAGTAPAFATDPTGDWKVADGVANIRVAECNGSMWGAVSWEQTPGGTDKNNPDASKQSRPTLGMPILIDMKRNSTGDKWAGLVYNAKDGKSYKSTIQLSSPDELEIQGCVMGFLCGGETWTRAGPPIPSSPANSLAKGAPKAPGASATAAPKTAPPKMQPPGTPKGSRMAAADPVGDICLLPDIARFAH